MVQHHIVIPRNQMCFSSLEDTILPGNLIHFVNAFAEALSLQALGFTIHTIKAGVGPSFDSNWFLKIYLYR